VIWKRGVLSFTVVVLRVIMKLCGTSRSRGIVCERTADTNYLRLKLLRLGIMDPTYGSLEME
jgi:hypothetical protein